jgi:hypothetical protein
VIDLWSMVTKSLTPRLTGAGARSAEGTNTGHENGEAMASVGVRVEPTVRLVREVDGRVRLHGRDLLVDVIEHWPLNVFNYLSFLLILSA